MKYGAVTVMDESLSFDMWALNGETMFTYLLEVGH
jgi:hypothetical protein